MTARFGHLYVFGRGATPVGELLNVRTIAGRAQHLGDNDDFVGASSNATATVVGYLNSGIRAHLLVDAPVPASTLLAGHNIVRADVSLRARLSTENFADDDVYFGLYAVRTPVAINDATWEYFDPAAGATGKWVALGGGHGTDLSSDPLALIPWNATLAALSRQSANVVLMSGDITREVQRAASRLYHTFFLLKPMWEHDGYKTVEIVDPATFPEDRAAAHGSIRVLSTPAAAWFAVHPEGDVNYAGFYDALLTGEDDARLQTGNPQAGSVGPARVAAAANTTEYDLARMVAVGERAFSLGVTNPSAGKQLQAIRVPRTTTSTTSAAEAGWRFAPMVGYETTRYQAFRTRPGQPESAALVAVGGSNPYGLYDTDTTFKDPDAPTKTCLTVLARWWDAGAPAAGAEWKAESVGDETPVGALAAAGDRHEFAPFSGQWDPAVADNRAEPFAGEWRSCGDAVYCQLRATSSVVTYDGQDRHKLLVADAGLFKDNERVTVFEADLSGAVPKAHHATVIARILTPGADQDALILDRRLTLSDPASPGVQVTTVYSASAIVTNGVLAGTLKAIQRARLAADVAAGAASFTIDSTDQMPSTLGSLRVYNFATGLNDRVGYTRAAGVVSVSSGALARGYVRGDLVQRVDSATWAPIFFRLRPELGALRGEQLATARLLPAEPR